MVDETEQVTDEVEESLDDLLTEEKVEGADVEEQSETEEKEESEEQSEEETEESTPDSDKDKRDIPIQALLDEREKRQAAQKELEELRRKYEPQEQKEKRPDVFEDQDKYDEYVKNTISTESLKTRFELSRDFMSMIKDDYAEREAEFLEIAKDNPSLARELREHPNPARFAYETAVKHNKLKEMENIDEWREKEKARIRDEVLKELEAEKAEGAEKDKLKREAMTPSLAKGRSAAGTETVSEETLDEVLTNVK